MTAATTLGDVVSNELIASWRFLSTRVKSLPPVYRRQILREIKTDIGKALSDLQELPRS